MIRLKEYIDFVTTLTEMDEVKEGKFILPTSLTFKLEEVNHRELFREVLLTKKEEVNNEELAEPFEIDVLNITLKFSNE